MKTLRSQIMLGIGVVLALVIILGVNSIMGLNSLVSHARNIADKQIPVLVTDARLSNNVVERVALIRGYMLNQDEYYLDRFDDLTESSIALQEELLERSEKIGRAHV